ncbi:MAG: hypothetical protein KDK65_01050 [Chlamydiia bacterium]|nr:hypothetical protein [Chlamydiia bacterium]
MLNPYLENMLKAQRVPHAMLFVGPVGEKEEQAKELAQTLSSGVDIHEYHPEGKIGLHAMETLRQLTHEVYLPPFSAKKKVFLIYQAEKMWPVSANALLKTFEEPPVDTLIILLTATPESLLPTICSRAQKLTFSNPPLKSKDSPAVTLMAQPALQRLNAISTIAKTYEQEKKDLETELRKEMKPSDDLTAMQKQQMEKLIEAEVTRQTQVKINHFLEDLLGWYRDLNLLLVDRHTDKLYHNAHRTALEQRLQRGNVPAMEKIEHSVAETQLRLQRSVSLPLALENLMMHLLEVCYD